MFSKLRYCAIPTTLLVLAKLFWRYSKKELVGVDVGSAHYHNIVSKNLDFFGKRRLLLYLGHPIKGVTHDRD